MANLPNAKKAIKVIKRRTSQNNKVRDKMTKLIKKTQKLMEQGDTELAKQQYQLTQKSIDKAAKSRVVHPNKAKRLKSRIAKKLNNIK